MPYMISNEVYPLRTSRNRATRRSLEEMVEVCQNFEQVTTYFG